MNTPIETTPPQAKAIPVYNVACSLVHDNICIVKGVKIL